MPSATLNFNATLGSLAFGSAMTRTADGQIAHEVTLGAAKAGTLSTRSSDTAGTLTLAADHGITDGEVIDIYWDGGVCYGATVGTVSGTSVPFTGASGDVLPIATTAITTQVQQQINTAFLGTDLVLAMVLCDQKAHAVFYATASAELVLDLPAKEGWYWADEQTATNPVTGDSITHVMVTQGSTSAATLRIGLLYDSTE